MRLTIIMMTVCLLKVSATVTFAQKINLRQQHAPLKAVFDEIEKQTGYTVFIQSALLKKAKPVTVNLSNVSLEEAMLKILAGQHLDFAIDQDAVVVKEKEKTLTDKVKDFFADGGKEVNEVKQEVLQGRVLNDNNQPLPGATVRIAKTNITTLTDGNGRFTLRNVSEGVVLLISYVGYESKEIPASADLSTISLTPVTADLKEVTINKGYYRESQRFSTGSVVKVTSEEIERQPVSNPLATLAGRVPGMTVVQDNGNPGAKFNIQIRGQNSISQGSQPLFLIDGVPYSNDYVGTGDIVMGNGGQSPFQNINIHNIESIEVLKDADATAIYGSRGANGVVIITTKKGKVGKISFNTNFYQGFGQITRRIDLLKTQQYLEMRREAFQNDNIQPTAINAPDIVLWDTARYTDWQDYLIGGTANLTNINSSLSGGNEQTQFFLSGNYNKQTSVYPSDFAENSGAGHLNVNHSSKKNKFKIMISSDYSANKNELPSDLTYYINLPPNNPQLLDDEGNLIWSENGGTFSNPLSGLFRKSTAKTDNFLSNINLQYELFENLFVKVTGGYNFIQFNESYLVPKSSLDPNSSSSVSSSKFGNTTNKTWIVEPQIEYLKAIGNGKFNILIGTTIQNNNQNLYVIEASDFPNDALLEATAFANSVVTHTSVVQYRYQAVFGRINYNHKSKYILNLTGRRDGSSRFGPNKRISNFGSVGGAWIFSEEPFMKNTRSWLSFGKLRSSFGITGNDQIGDYQYLDNYSATSTRYYNIAGYIPSRLFNADYSWEQNKKLEIAMELGFLDDKLMFSTNWYRNRSDNQLINYKLPDQTGFPSILRNFGALVENSGWEFQLTYQAFNNKYFKWSIAGNLTAPRNKLLSFPNLDASSYASTLEIGYPLNIAKYLHWTGVDPSTGLHTFTGTSRPDNQTEIADFTPRYFAGLTNSFTYKNWDLNFLFQFTQQKKQNYITSFGGYAPGMRYNQPVEVLERWQQDGDNTPVQRFTANSGQASTQYNYYSSYSDGRVSDGSYARLKNLSISYSIPNELCERFKVNALKIFYQGQNLLTITDYKGLDPETGTSSLPPIAINSFGVQLTL